MAKSINKIKIVGALPYSRINGRTDEMLDHSSPSLDYWSVGMVMLEIIVGSVLVKSIQRVRDVEIIMGKIERYLPERLYELIDDLLFHPDCTEFSTSAFKLHQTSQNLVAQGVRALE